MAGDRDLGDPRHTAVVCVECQRGVLGPDSVLPVLRDDTGPLLAGLGRLLAGARASEATVVHATYEGGLGGSNPTGTAPLWRTLAPRTAHFAPGHPDTRVLPELLGEGDLVIPRHHGLCPTKGSELMPVLRGRGVRTVVLTGVSVNLALPLAAGDLVHEDFAVVIPTDAVGGTPPDYARLALRHTLAMLATLTSVDDLLAHWGHQ
jgi:nicotinamidase-related amidase